MGDQPTIERGGVRYERVGSDYLEQRKLRRHANWVLLWALGVGAVISGDFFGWNFGLDAGGFGGLLVATALMALMYLCMVYSIAELSTALPHAGGFYSFTRSAFGPWGGYLVGVTDTIEYVITPAVIVVGIGGYMNTLFPSVPIWIWWLIFYAIFVGINIMGVEITLKVGLIVTLLAMLVLAVGITWVVSRSKLGYCLAAGGEEPEAAQSLGINVARVKLVAMAISSFLTSLAGTFWAQFTLYIHPKSVMSLDISFEIAFIALIGGRGSIAGPLLGALLLRPVSDFSRIHFGDTLPGLHLVIFGGVLILVMLYQPRGLQEPLTRLYRRAMARWAGMRERG